jgi:hypothetical protein
MRKVYHLGTAMRITTIRWLVIGGALIALAAIGLRYVSPIGDNRAREKHVHSPDGLPQEPGKQAVVRLVRGDPKMLVVQNEDLPAGLGMAGGEHAGANRYSQIYFNPRALLSTGEDEPGLLGVIVNVALLDSAAAANREFSGQGGLDPTSVTEAITEATPDAIPLEVEAYAALVAGVDELLAFRVSYLLQETHIYEYRYRLLVANAVANLIISAPSTPDGLEPDSLRESALAIVKRQVARLNGARG